MWYVVGNLFVGTASLLLCTMVLSDGEIVDALDSGELAVKGSNERCLGPSSLDLHLYPTIARRSAFNGHCVDVADETTYCDWDKDDDLYIHPGEFVLATTDEWISLSNELVGFVDGRSSVGRLGLQVENAGLVDAGFSGQITLELKNQSRVPIELAPQMRIAQIAFHRHGEYADVGYADVGKYDMQVGPTPSRLYEDFDLGEEQNN